MQSQVRCVDVASSVATYSTGKCEFLLYIRVTYGFKSSLAVTWLLQVLNKCHAPFLVQQTATRLNNNIWQYNTTLESIFLVNVINHNNETINPLPSIKYLAIKIIHLWPTCFLYCKFQSKSSNLQGFTAKCRHTNNESSGKNLQVDFSVVKPLDTPLLSTTRL